MNFDITQHLFTNHWFVYEDFYKMIGNLQGINKIAEVGVWKGHAISFLVQEMLKANKTNIEAYAVDIWQDWDIPNPEIPHIYNIYNEILKLRNVREYIKDIKCRSDEAASQFEDHYFDFVYIDADHEKQQVKKDILAWFPKVKPGKILAGHDYYQDHSNGNDVKAIVDELILEGFFPNKVDIVPGNVWITYV